jgi:hypothetical protein
MASPDDARKERGRVPVNQGIHPEHCRRAERVATDAEGGHAFEAVARQGIAKQKTAWTSDCRRQVARWIEADVLPRSASGPSASHT